MLRILHTADLHLDSPLRSLALRKPESVATVHTATRTAFERIVKLCLHEQVDALLIAGDLFDGAQSSAQTLAFLQQQLRLLDAADVAVFMVRGNHDAESPLAGALSLPPNVHVFADHDEPVALAEGRAHIHGVSFPTRHVSESLLPRFAPPVAGSLNIGLLHTSLAGSPGHDVYAPCALGDLRSFGYDYWALGHIHLPRVHGTNPAIVMAGCPQGRNSGESGRRTVTLARFDEQGHCTLEHHSVAPVRFETLRLNLADDQLVDAALQQTLHEQLHRLRMQCDADEVFVRIELCLADTLHWKIQRDLSLWEAQIDEFCLDIGGLWLDRLRLERDRPTAEPANAHAIDDSVLHELQQLAQEAIDQDAALIHRATQLMDELVGQLPPACRDTFGHNAEARERTLRTLMQQGSEQLFEQLQQGD